jgi:hypothetical protein
LTDELKQKLRNVTLNDKTRADIRLQSTAPAEPEDNDWEVDARDIAEMTLDCRKFSYGATNRVTTEAIAIECAEADAKLLRARLSAAMLQQLMPKGLKYIPRAAAQHLGEEDYRKILQDQAAMMRRSVSVPISGITPDAMAFNVEITDDNGFTTHMTLKQAIERNTRIRRVEPTNDTRRGKWLLITERQAETDVQKYADEQLAELFKQIPGDNYLRSDQWHTPSRSDRPPTYDEEAKVYAMLKIDAAHTMIHDPEPTETNTRSTTNNKRKHGAIMFQSRDTKRMTYAMVASHQHRKNSVQPHTNNTHQHTDHAQTNYEQGLTDDDSATGTSCTATPTQLPVITIEMLTARMEHRMAQWMTQVEQKINAQQQPNMNELMQAMQHTLQTTVQALMESIATETMKAVESRLATHAKTWETTNQQQRHEIETLQTTIQQMQNPGHRSPSRLIPPMASRLHHTAGANREPGGEK